jgi:hypothetical protein
VQALAFSRQLSGNKIEKTPKEEGLEC